MEDVSLEQKHGEMIIKMEKEFNLSEKEMNLIGVEDVVYSGIYFRKEIKEFIKRLKEEIFMSDCYGAGEHMCARVDLLAGNGLQ